MQQWGEEGGGDRVRMLGSLQGWTECEKYVGESKSMCLCLRSEKTGENSKMGKKSKEEIGFTFSEKRKQVVSAGSRIETTEETRKDYEV